MDTCDVSGGLAKHTCRGQASLSLDTPSAPCANERLTKTPPERSRCLFVPFLKFKVYPYKFNTLYFKLSMKIL